MTRSGAIDEARQRLFEFRHTPLVDDVVGAVFVYSNSEKVSSDLRMLQSFFYELAADPEYQELMRDFEFSADRYPFPFSHDLEPALGRLQNRKIINAHNPAFDWYGIEDEGRQRMMLRIERKFDEDQQELLRRAGERLSERAELSDPETDTTSQAASKPN
jgi:hypothetical protein